MKRIIFITLLSVFLFPSCDTNPAVSKAFAKYAYRKDVTTVTVPGWAIRLGSKFGDLDKEERELLDGIDKVKVMSIENDDLNARINLHEEFHTQINKNKDYEELLTVNDKGENITIFGKMHEDVIEEMIVLVGGDENVMVYLKGEISPEMLNNVVNLSGKEKVLGLN